MNDVKNAMKEVLSKTSSIDIYQITSVNVEDQTYTIKQLNYNKSFDDVPMMGVGLGHGKGQLILLEENDLVLVAFLAGSLTPYILGSIFNTFMVEPDTKIPISTGDYFIAAKTNGSYIRMKSDKSIDINGAINIQPQANDAIPYTAGMLGFTNASWGFIFRPPVAGTTASHLFVNYANDFILEMYENKTSKFYGALTVAGAVTTSGTVTIANYTLPTADGTNGQVLKTDGAGTLSWQNDNV